MSRWFTSDPHFGHEKIAHIRGFGLDLEPLEYSSRDSKIAAEVHDRYLIEKWQQRIRSEDLVYILGDISAGGAAATRHALDILSTLPGRKILIAGNHDPIHPMNRDAHKWHDEFSQVFEYYAPYGRVKINGADVLLSHFPYERDRVGTEPRYTQYRLPNEGLPLLHGHTHGTERLTLGLDVWRVIPRREIHVGIDAWGLAPVHEEAIVERLHREII